VLDDQHGTLQIGQRDLTLRVTLDRVQRGSDLFVVRLELVVDRLDHLSDSLVQRDLGGFLFDGFEFGFLQGTRKNNDERSAGKQQRHKETA
jgi:hypothetical protein